MRSSDICETKNRLGDLASRGETSTIAGMVEPLTKVSALEAEQTAPARRLGFMTEQIVVAGDFDSLGGAEIEETFGSSE